MGKPNLAIFTSASGGLSHYSTHLFKPLKKYVNPYYVTYQDAVVDEFVKDHVSSINQIIKNGSPSSILMTLKFLKENKIDYINFNVATTARKSYFHYVALLSKAKEMGIEVIGTLHDVMPFESFYIDPAALELLYSTIDHYIVGNESELAKLQLYFQVPRNKISIIPHGPYLLFDNKKYNKESARKKLNIPQNKKVILFFGLLRPHKGLKYLIKAFKKVVKEVPNAWLYISSDLSYSPQQNELLQRLERSGVSKFTQLVKKYIPSNEIEMIFKAADIVVMPYTIVSQSGILNLSYAFKKPVIITNIFNEANIVDRKFGRAVKSEDVSSLEQAIIEMLRMPKRELEKMGENGYKYATKNDSWDKAAEKFNKIIENLKNEKK